MNIILRTTICLAVMSMANIAYARPVRLWSYSELTKRADVVAIVEFEQSVDSKKPAHAFGKKYKLAAEVVTQLKPLVFFKGDQKDTDELLLIHFRLKNPKQIPPNGPQFVTFQKNRRYLVFLKKRGNEHYEPVNGQMDPIYSIRLLPR